MSSAMKDVLSALSSGQQYLNIPSLPSLSSVTKSCASAEPADELQPVLEASRRRWRGRSRRSLGCACRCRPWPCGGGADAGGGVYRRGASLRGTGSRASAAPPTSIPAPPKLHAPCAASLRRTGANVRCDHVPVQVGLGLVGGGGLAWGPPWWALPGPAGPAPAGGRAPASAGGPP